MITFKEYRNIVHFLKDCNLYETFVHFFKHYTKTALIQTEASFEYCKRLHVATVLAHLDCCRLLMDFSRYLNRTHKFNRNLYAVYRDWEWFHKYYSQLVAIHNNVGKTFKYQNQIYRIISMSPIPMQPNPILATPIRLTYKLILLPSMDLKPTKALDCQTNEMTLSRNNSNCICEFNLFQMLKEQVEIINDSIDDVIQEHINNFMSELQAKIKPSVTDLFNDNIDTTPSNHYYSKYNTTWDTITYTYASCNNNFMYLSKI